MSFAALKFVTIKFLFDMLYLSFVLIANWATIVYLSGYLGKCNAIAKIELLNLSFILGIEHSQSESLFCTRTCFWKAVD